MTYDPKEWISPGRHRGPLFWNWFHKEMENFLIGVMAAAMAHHELTRELPPGFLSSFEELLKTVGEMPATWEANDDK